MVSSSYICIHIMNITSHSCILLFLFTGLFFSCKPEPFNDSIIPSINIEQLTVVKDPNGLDSSIEVRLSYQDGDGNIGLSDADTFFPHRFGQPHFNNLWINLEKDSAGVWVPTSDDSLLLSQRVLNLTPNGDIKSIRGEFTIRIPVPPTPFFTDKKIRLFFELVDRDLQVSNRVQSRDLNLTY